MRVLMLHNHYQLPGGEDECFAAEAALLEAHGHEVERFVLHNDEVPRLGLARTAARTIWNAEAYRALRERIRRHRPDVVHAHNLFPLISPAALRAAKAEGVAVVLTMHNLRLFCVRPTLFRDGRVCEDCVGRAFAWPGVLHGCYRGSRPMSAGVAAMSGIHRLLGTWRDCVDVFVALTGFVRSKMVQGGIAPDRIMLKPNFLLHDPGPGPAERPQHAVFAGRLTQEKGVPALIEAWRRLPGDATLELFGDGPLNDLVRQAAGQDTRIMPRGHQPLPVVQEAMRRAGLVVAPSEVPETFGRIAIEAFAVGTPVLTVALGGLGELVEDGVTGALVPPGDPVALAAAAQRMLGDPASLRRMGEAARATFEKHFTAEANHAALMRVYAAARGRAALLETTSERAAIAK
ncbi:glycosyltransferase [Falsiroseomonas sp. HW251]|uniref:glycosyltransferase n=1 Tax=Falsiroseomonas sp. HW251 TaxID=3390998 RepID=UPI003D314302